MSADHVHFIFLLLISYNNHVLPIPVTPTVSNSSGEWYIAQNSTTNGDYAFADITCSSSNCYIYCSSSPEACLLLDIEAYAAINLEIHCDHVESCKQIRVKTGPTSLVTATSTKIYCTAQASCSGAILNLNSSSSVDIICNNPNSLSLTDGACTAALIYTPRNDDNVNIFCGDYDCQNVYLWVKPLAYQSYLTCNGTNACNNIDVTCVDNTGSSNISYNTLTSTWECNDNICCPLVSSVVTCDEPFNCVIYCNDTLINCMNSYIDGTTALSLIVYCENDKDCFGSKIQCPGHCTVKCNGDQSCENVLIDATDTISLDLSCSAPNACKQSSIYCPYTTEDACHIQCDAYAYVCNSMEIYSGDGYIMDSYLDLTCPDPMVIEPCTGLTFECSTINNQISTYLYQSYPNYQCDTQICCPWTVTTTLTPSPINIDATTSQPTSLSTLSLLSTTEENLTSTKDENATESDDGTLLIIIVALIGLLVLILIGIGIYCAINKRKQTNYGSPTSPKRGSKSTTKAKQSSQPDNDGQTGINLVQGNSNQYGQTLELEKSMEMASQTQQTITDISHHTITTYNPSKNNKTHINHQSNVTNSQNIGLADLGGWE